MRAEAVGKPFIALMQSLQPAHKEECPASRIIAHTVYLRAIGLASAAREPSMAFHMKKHPGQLTVVIKLGKLPVHLPHIHRA